MGIITTSANTAPFGDNDPTSPFGNYSFYQQWPLNWSSQFFGGTGDGYSQQIAELSGRVYYMVLYNLTEFPDKIGLLVSLMDPRNSLSNGSAGESYITGSNSGTMCSDFSDSDIHRSQNKGWFLVGCATEITTNESSAILHQWAPLNTNDAHTVSSSISISAGFMGRAATGSGSYSNSFSSTIDDIIYSDGTDNDPSLPIQRTLQVMGAHSKGQFEINGETVSFTTLMEANDNPSQFNSDLASGLSSNPGLIPHDPARNSYINQPLVNQALFLLDSDISNDVVVYLNMQAVFGAVSQNFEMSYYGDSSYQQFHLGFVVPFSQIISPLKKI